MKEEDFTRILELEEEFVQKTCEDIIRVKPDIVFTEKGVSDLAQHYLVKVNFFKVLILFIKGKLISYPSFDIKGWHYCHSSRKEIG